MTTPLLKDPAVVLPVALAFAANVTSVTSISFMPRQILPMAELPTTTNIISGNDVSLSVAGGTDGEIYDVNVTAALTGGGMGDRTFAMAVITRAWAMPDGTTGWLDVHEFIQRLGLDDTIAATDRNGSGGIDLSYLTGALIDAQAECEVFLAARYALPLSAVPSMLKAAVYDIARSRLYPRGLPEGVAEAAKASRSNLARISKGDAMLPGVAGVQADPATTTSDPILGFASDRTYPDNLVDY
jgi:phage gp36-like protein